MTNASEPSLSIDEVAKSFAEAEQLLSETRRRLESIIEAEERSRSMAASVAESAHGLATLAASAAGAVEGLEQALASSREVLTAGSQVLDGTALAQIGTGNAELLAQTRALIEGLSSLRSSNIETTQEVRQQLAALQSAISELGQDGRAMRRRLYLIGLLLVLGEVGVAAMTQLT